MHEKGQSFSYMKAIALIDGIQLFHLVVNPPINEQLSLVVRTSRR